MSAAERLVRGASDAWKQWDARIANKAFLEYQRLLSRLFARKKLKLHFSRRKEWMIPLRAGFESTGHEIAFGEFSHAAIRGCDLAVPLTMDDLKVLAGAGDLAAGSPIPIPSMECLLLCDNKYLLNQALIENGFGKFVPRMGGHLPFPFILKKKVDEWGKNSHVISDEQTARRFSDKLADPDYFTQEFLPGRYEYTTHILFQDRKIVRSLNVEYYFATETPIKGKDVAVCTKVCRCPHLDVFASILLCLGFEGLCCFNYKLRGRQPFILEINPRFGGSLSPFFFSFLRHLG